MRTDPIEQDELFFEPLPTPESLRHFSQEIKAINKRMEVYHAVKFASAGTITITGIEPEPVSFKIGWHGQDVFCLDERTGFLCEYPGLVVYALGSKITLCKVIPWENVQFSDQIPFVK